MTEHDSSARSRRDASGARSSTRKGAPSGSAASTTTASVSATPEATRGGEDTRRRGWFWHWNSIVTQYAPLLGLKGVGLLNSYTVWTDRREESPHRGYAFPSQQSEADFYGEDRAELITINKILVALDLIEIHKEMVLRTDPQGRRWKVPHNFYRVKDHDDGFALTAQYVLRVVELADQDKNVYRYVRRIFSPRFAPIDGANVWVGILPELRQTELWQRLAARAGREEDKNSARTRAGHAARKANFGMPNDGDMTTKSDTANDSGRVTSLPPLETSVAYANNGSVVDVDGTNEGLAEIDATSVGPVNAATATAVAPVNTTYHQPVSTTTTRNDRAEKYVESNAAAPETESPMPASKRQSLSVPREIVAAMPATASLAAGPGERPAPADAPGETAAIRAFEDANARRATPAERQLLRGLAERFDPIAQARGAAALTSGWAWVAAAVYEAVEAGSAFVAPRRIREILGRWEREGLPGSGDDATEVEPTRRRDGAAVGDAGQAAGGAVPRSAPERPLAELLGFGPDLALPHGFGGRQTWAFTVGLLAGAVERARLVELVAGTAIVGYHDGEVTIAAADPIQAERLATEYRDLVARKLGEAMRRPVRVAILAAPTAGPPSPAAATGERGTVDSAATAAETFADDDADEPAVPSFVVPECGLPSWQVWAAVLDEVRDAGEVSRANFDTWLRVTALIGREPDGALVVGAPHALAQRRIEARFLPQLRAGIATVAGARLPLHVVVAADWLRANPRARSLGVSPSREDRDVQGA